ncbi:NADPH-dependent 2,4-dienoyl-CoA reductase, sulfur reductase [Virgibacillus subterraneus]|uniref:NADPH-dependent 2,4-dienoyl-CoA reductase, sulfur reductase n=2 Tax=Virgibacillus TaxID=84406 RepID=A0A1H1GBU5_9BACI|nr:MULTISPECIES: CoA-disulfide reductase [Virgibacillus]SDR10296.1 NADPH-dependent 2,4-dienoyl-CoA reductase, sulfur reductase [Virgibacillus salinus]SEQ84795.1 NADPH-dependent 2,4-dienoyl-CoA reductase, sulfur reductase [Virgibacillus subterraneus]
MTNQIIIVGGVGGGATAAAQIRRVDKESEIILFDKGNYVAFSNCGMPYYIGGTVDERDDLLVDNHEFAKKYDINLKTDSEVVSINREQKQIEYKNNGAIQHETYNKLVLSPGASAIEPNLKGLNPKQTFTLHTIPDMDDIYAFINEHKPRTCAIIGAGFVGLEMVENLKSLDIECTVVDRSKQVMKLVDEDMATIIQDHLKAKGVNLILEDGLDSFTNNGSTLHLNSGKSIQADMTILAVGIKPNTKIAEDSSLDIGETGAIKVNEYMQTNDPDIYALGDVVETQDYLTDTPRHVALAWPAHRQAFIIANHLQDNDLAYKGTQGSAIFKVFDLSVAVSGYSSHALNKLAIPFKEVTHESLSHAGYYPGAEKISMKILFEENNGQILGAQVIGEDGVHKRLAVIATAMKGKISVEDLAELELGYAPPYSSPKDPINIIGYKAGSMMDK